MILTFEPDKYRDLLSKYQHKIIINEEENQKALEIVEALMHCQNRTPEEDELSELLIVLIEKFEREYYAPGEGSTPHSMLRFLMEQQGIKQADLVGVIGSQGMVSEVVNEKREISKAQANALGKFFQVDPGLFI